MTGFLRVALLVLSSLVCVAAQPASSPSAHERPILTDGAGPRKIRVDGALAAGAQPFTRIDRGDAGSRAAGGLGDLRLVDEGGREIPYLLFDPPPPAAEWMDGTLLVVPPAKTSSGVEVDLGSRRLVDGIRVQGLPPPFMKRFRLEGSGDRARWTLLVAQGTLFDLPAEGVRQTDVTFPAGEYRYLRLVWDDATSARVRLPQAVRARAASAARPMTPVLEPVRFEEHRGEPRRSRYRVTLPSARLPIVALVIDARGGDVFRTAAVLESRFAGTRAEPVEIGRARLSGTAGGDGGPVLLRVPVQRPETSELQVVIDNGSNPPLSIASIRVELAQLPWVYFEAPGGAVTARYGSDAAAPQYDLEARRDGIALDAVREARWGDPRPSADDSRGRGAPADAGGFGAPVEVSGFRFRRPIASAPAGLVALPLDAAALAHSAGPSRGFPDIRIVHADGRQLPYLLERRDEPLTVELRLEPGDVRDSAAAREPGNRSVHALPLPDEGLPASRLVLETSDRVFRRTLRIGAERAPDRRHRDRWFEVLASAEWRHADQGVAAPPLEVPLPDAPPRDLRLVVEEGDNQPLTITAARLLLPSWRVRFFQPDAPLWLVYGRPDAERPAYDLALLAPAVLGAEAREISAGPEESAARARTPFVPPVVFWAGIGAAVLVLLGLIGRLLKSNS